jgi:hypothetical protein
MAIMHLRCIVLHFNEPDRGPHSGQPLARLLDDELWANVAGLGKVPRPVEWDLRPIRKAV